MRRALLAFVLIIFLLPVGLAQECSSSFGEAAWWTAQREMRRRFPIKADSIQAVQRPPTRFHCGPIVVSIFFGPALGITALEQDGSIGVTIGITGDEREDYWSLVHEYLHVINWQLELKHIDHLKTDQWIESEYAAHTK